MSIRFVIPTGADPDAQAWQQRPETWRELAEQVGDDVIIEHAGSDWCVAHGIDGLGFCTEQSGQPVVGDVAEWQ